MTASIDKTFKVWHEVQRAIDPTMSTPAFKPHLTQWGCRGVGCYRDFNVNAVSFSGDGSLLAVVYGQVVTLWDPATVTLRQALVHPAPSEPVRWAQFVANTPYLVAATSQTLFCWDLLSLSVWWSYRLPVVGLAVDNTCGQLAVVVEMPPEAWTEDKAGGKAQQQQQGSKRRRASVDADEPAPIQQCMRAILFDARSPTPLAVWQLTDVQCEYDGHKTAALQFVSPRGATQGPASLLYLNTRKQLVRIDGMQQGKQRQLVELEVNDGGKASAQSQAAQEEKLSLFEQIYGTGVTQPKAPEGEAADAAAVDVEEAMDGNELSRAVSGLLEAPAHALPPSSALLAAYLQLVTPRIKAADKDVEEEAAAMEVDEDEEGDAGAAVSGSGEELSAALGAAESLLADETKDGFFQWKGAEAYGALVGGLAAAGGKAARKKSIKKANR